MLRFTISRFSVARPSTRSFALSPSRCESVKDKLAGAASSAMDSSKSASAKAVDGLKAAGNAFNSLRDNDQPSVNTETSELPEEMRGMADPHAGRKIDEQERKEGKIPQDMGQGGGTDRPV